MNLQQKLAAVQGAKTTVDVVIGKQKHKVRLQAPDYNAVIAWGDESTAIDKAVEAGEIASVSSHMKQIILCLRHTMIVDDEQPALTDEELAGLVKASGGLSKETGRLAKTARDMMWEAAGFPSEQVEEALDKELARHEVPLGSPDGTT